MKHVQGFTNSCVSGYLGPHQLKWTAQTGRQQPNMSTTFMGRSRPLDDVWRQTPRSAEPKTVKPIYTSA